MLYGDARGGTAAGRYPLPPFETYFEQDGKTPARRDNRCGKTEKTRPHDMTITHAPDGSRYRAAWKILFAGYCRLFTRSHQTAQDARDLQWWADGTQTTQQCILAQDETAPRGFTHYRRVSVSCARMTNCFSGRTFVQPQARVPVLPKR